MVRACELCERRGELVRSGGARGECLFLVGEMLRHLPKMEAACSPATRKQVEVAGESAERALHVPWRA